MTTDAMKRTFTLVLAVLAAAAVFGGLVHGVLVAAHVSEPAASTVYGLTLRRFWATAAAGLALVGAVIGGLALFRAVRRIGNHGRRGAVVALVLGPIGLVLGGLIVVTADGGVGTGNGLAGGVVAMIVGTIGMALGGLTLARSRRAG